MRKTAVLVAAFGLVLSVAAGAVAHHGATRWSVTLKASGDNLAALTPVKLTATTTPQLDVHHAVFVAAVQGANIANAISKVLGKCLKSPCTVTYKPFKTAFAPNGPPAVMFVACVGFAHDVFPWDHCKGQSRIVTVNWKV